MKIKPDVIIILLLFIGAFAFRIYGLSDNHPLWVDEFSTANQVELIRNNGISVFSNRAIYFETNKAVSTILSFLSSEIFGQNPYALRLPSAIVGSFVPAIIYLIMRTFSTIPVALSGSLLSLASYLFILWSRQARGYVSLQLIILLTTLLYFKYWKHKSGKFQSVFFLSLIILGLFTHPLFYIFLLSLFIHAYTPILLPKKLWIPSHLISRNFKIFALIFLSTSIYIGMLTINVYRDSLVGLSNFLWYYHSFIWGQYSLTTFLGITGLLIGLFTNRKYVSLFSIHLVLHLLFITFLFKTATSRYLLPVMPYFFIGTALSFDAIYQQLKKVSKKNLQPLVVTLPVALSLFIIFNGHKYVRTPQKFYSLNNDFQEIALIDYDEIYNIILDKGDISGGNTAVIDTWVDRSAWYLGNNHPAMYNFRWLDEGIMKKTRYVLNEKQEKVMYKRENVGVILNEDDLLDVIDRYPTGFLIVDDASMNKDVLSYAETNLKKELHLDHYPLDQNPFSRWPITLYSWGFE